MDAIEAELARIDEELVRVQKALVDYVSKVADETNTNVVDSTDQMSGYKGSQHYAMLREREQELLDLKSRVTLYDEPVPVAIGPDTIGTDQSETVTD